MTGVAPLLVGAVGTDVPVVPGEALDDGGGVVALAVVVCNCGFEPGVLGVAQPKTPS